MAIKITSVAEAVQDNGIKILVYGLAGSGKTRLCATTGEPTLILNIEGGLLSIKDIAPEFIHSAKVKNLDDLDEVYTMLLSDQKKGEQFYKWVALDSITDIAEEVLKNELAACADPRKSYPAFQSKVDSAIKKFRDLPHYHVVMTAKMEMSKDDFTGITLRRPMMPGNKLGPAIPYLYDEVFALRVEKDPDTNEDYRVVQTNRDVMYDAKDRSDKLNQFERPDLKLIHDKIYGKKVAVESTVRNPNDKPAEESEEQTDDAAFYWYHDSSETVGVCYSKEEFENICDQSAGEIEEISKESFDKAVKNGANVSDSNTVATAE